MNILRLSLSAISCGADIRGLTFFQPSLGNHLVDQERMRPVESVFWLPFSVGWPTGRRMPSPKESVLVDPPETGVLCWSSNMLKQRPVNLKMNPQNLNLIQWIWIPQCSCACLCAGYAETSVDKLASALYQGLVSYNELSNFVFFKEAVFHAARLSRVLVGSNHF